MHHADIIQALGGPAKLAAELSCDRSRAVRWQKAGIPPRRWKAIADLAKKRAIAGVTLDTIAKHAPPQRGESA